MKKISILLLFVSLFAWAGAQSFTESISNVNTKLNVAEFSDIILVGEMNGKTIGVTNRFNHLLGNYMKKECRVLAFDGDMNLAGSFDIPETKDNENLGATLYEGKVYILTRRKEKSDVYYERFVVDPAKMQLVEGPTTIYHYTGQRKDDSYSWSNQSPDGMLTGFIHITTNRKNDKFDAVEFLLDEQMNVEWRMEYPIYSLSHIIVTNDGEIVTIGKSGEKNLTRSRIYISFLDGDNAVDISESTKVFVSDIRLISYAGGKILATGIGINPANEDDVQYFGIAANVKSQEMNLSYKSITDDEKNVFVNHDLGRNAKAPSTDAMFMRHYQTTDFGAVSTIHLRWSVTVCNQNGACSTTCYQEGVLVYAISDDGEIIWHHPIRSSYREKGLSWLISSSLFVDGSTVYFLQSENSKWPSTYDISKKIKTLTVNKGSKVIGIYRISESGKVTKSIKTLDKSNILSCSMRRLGDNYVGFLSTGKGVSRYDVKFR